MCLAITLPLSKFDMLAEHVALLYFQYFVILVYCTYTYIKQPS